MRRSLLMAFVLIGCGELHVLAIDRLNPQTASADSGLDAGDELRRDAGALVDAGRLEGDAGAVVGDAGVEVGPTDSGLAFCKAVEQINPPDVASIALKGHPVGEPVSCAPQAAGPTAVFRVTVPGNKVLLVSAEPYPPNADDVVLFLRDSACSGPTSPCQDAAPAGAAESLSYKNPDSTPRTVLVGVKTWAAPTDRIVLDFTAQ